MIRVLGTVFAALLGLAFGSFLNVCLSRWPEGESIVTPRSHCRTCGRVLAWWENVPLLSWVALRGRCRGCGAWIGWRYVFVEAAVGGLWAAAAWQAAGDSFERLIFAAYPLAALAMISLKLVFLWVLVGLAFLDGEHLWLPDWLTIPGIALGLISALLKLLFAQRLFITSHGFTYAAVSWIAGVVAAAALILLIRWVHWLVRRREGIGLGDAKLMALLAAWLGFSGALLSFGIGVVLGALLAVLIPLVPRKTLGQGRWSQVKLPLGTFLCIGGVVSALWGQRIIAAYLRWAGF
jgi:leader peptidase (prepilin peptidase)/N-methyltransferase